MKPGSIRFLSLAVVASLPLMAQQPSPSPQPPPGSPPQATSPQQTNPEPGASQNSNPNAPPSTGTTPQVSSPKLSPVTVELESKLDTKDAKNGDSVVVKTTETATTPNGTEIPKGSEIKGHIVGVAPKGQEGPNSRVAIQFDQAQLQTGQSLQIRSVIQSVSPAGTTGAQPSGAAGNPPASGNPPPASSKPPGASPSDPAQPGDPQTPGTVVATKGNLAIKTTAIPGVLLIGDVYGRPFADAAGALLGANRDVHLDGGTVMVVAIMTAPPAVGTK